MNTKDVYSYTKIQGIEIGEVINVSYDSLKDIVLIVEDMGNRGTVKHCFGSKAEGLSELVDALEIYQQKKFDERKKIFNRIREATGEIK